jgi:hypothetical protein
VLCRDLVLCPCTFVDALGGSPTFGGPMRTRFGMPLSFTDSATHLACAFATLFVCRIPLGIRSVPSVFFHRTYGPTLHPASDVSLVWRLVCSVLSSDFTAIIASICS